MKIVITGGAGFIGSNLAEELSKENDVTIVDDLSTGKIENIKSLNVKFIKGSVTDFNLLKNVFKDVDYVFHQAAIASVQKSIEDPKRTDEVNAKGTLNVLIAARDSEVKKVIYASSSAVYGDTPELPKREDMMPNLLSPYAVTKLIGEYYCKVFNDVYGLKTISLRYFNVYGPKQDPYSDYAAVIPKFINMVLENKPPVIYGDGRQTRDFTFVKDVVMANILAMRSDATGVYNITNGNAISINELAEIIINIIEKNLKPIYKVQREGDIKHSLGNISKARKDLGYEPKYSFDKGIAMCSDYFLKEKTDEKPTI